MTLTPLPGWALCRTLEHSMETTSGLVLPKDIDKDVKSEGAAIVVAVTPPHKGLAGIEVGDKILYRGFLRFANQVGHFLGSQRDCEYFFLNVKDVLAVIEGTGSIGLHGEYRV
jgi:co-chaperonin GroES (HSP10)